MVKYFDVNNEGHSIKCKLYCNEIRNIEKIVLFGHGFGGHKDNKAAERFAENLLSKYKKYAVMTFNWPCHGDDVKKKLILADCSKYIELVIKHIRETMNIDHIDAYATSFGGYLFLKYMIDNENPFKRVTLRNPAVKMFNVITNTIMKGNDYDKLLKGKDVLVGFDRKIAVSKQFLDELEASDISKRDFTVFFDQILIIQGKKDEVVNYDDVYEFANDNCIEFISVENADHRFKDYALMGDAIKAIISYINE